MVDSHAHLDSERYAGELDAVLDRAWAAGVRAILAVGIGDGPSTMQRALELARQYGARPGTPALWASAGIHPQEASAADQAALAKLDALLAEPEVIACGEIGLDYYHADNPPRAVQQRAFRDQMTLAAARGLPILIHCRPTNDGKAGETDAWDDTLALLEDEWQPTGLGGVLHCFTGRAEHARRALAAGFLISFAGNLTYPSNSALRDIAAGVPLDQLLIETDAPFLAPVPHRGRRNEPALVAEVARTLGPLRGLSPEEVAAVTSENFHRFFRIADTIERSSSATPALR
jgi:TatD DNase family protein